MQSYPDMAEIMKIAKSSSAQKLIELLQKQGGSSLQEALNNASSGNYDAARQSLSPLLASAEIRKLLNDLEGKL